MRQPEPAQPRAEASAADFDAYANSYDDDVNRSIGFIGAEHEFFVEAKARTLLELVRARLGAPRSVTALDVGCGPGLTDAALDGAFAKLAGVDVSPSILERAAERNAGVEYHLSDGRRLPFDDGSFDVTFAICVLHHVPPSERDSFLAEMARVTASPGIVAVFEHNPLNPLTRLAVRNCSFDHGVRLVMPGELSHRLAGTGARVTDRRFIVFIPWRSRILAAAERGLRWLPLGGQYVVAGAVSQPAPNRRNRHEPPP